MWSAILSLVKRVKASVEHVLSYMTMRRKYIRIGAALLLFVGMGSFVLLRHVPVAFADTAPTADALQAQLDAHTQEIAQLNQEIAQYEIEIQKAGADKKTLQEAIDALDLQRKTVQAQISVTQNQISSIRIQIEQLGSNIADTEDSISADQAALAENVRSLEQAEEQPMIIRLISSSSLSAVWHDADALLQVQDAVQGNVRALQTHKATLAASEAVAKQKQDALTAQKQTLTSQQQSLTQTTKSKAQLLAETNAQEANYQRLLAQAKAELSGFSAFAQNAGGSGLLANQTSCDSWGCYYNQRDATWGNDPLNGTKYLLKSDGCLITSLAMVLTHYGHTNVTPISINANPQNFAVYYPAYLLYTIYVDGISATRKSATIDATLAKGDPVIVGINAYGGTHYVVLTSGRAGNYLMRDPYIANGKDISFSAHYSMRKVFGIAKVILN